MMPIPLFQPVSAPRITSLSRKDLVEWKAKRVRYLRLIDAHNAGPAVSVKDSFAEEVLDALCRWELNTDVEFVDDDTLNAIIDRQFTDGSVCGNAGSIPVIFKGMAIDLSEPDPFARCLKLFTEMDYRSKSNGLDAYFRANPKAKVKHIVDALRPGELRVRVNQVLEFEDLEARKDPQKLWKIVLEKTRIFNEVFLSQKFHKISYSNDTSKPNNKQGRMNVNKSGAMNESNITVQKTKASKVKEKMPINIKDKKQPRDGCWHCGGDHFLNECNITDEEKAQVAARKNEEFRNKRAIKRVCNSGPSDVDMWTVVFSISNGERISIPATADPGPDETIVPSELIDKLKLSGVEVEVQDVAPRTFILGNVKHMLKTCTQTVKLRLRLNTPMGVVTFPEEECVIMEGSNWEILIGNPILKKVGINVKEQLEALAREQQDDVESDLDIDTDAMMINSNFNWDKQLEMILNNAKSNGMPKSMETGFRELLMSHQSEFETEVKPGLPADVPPMKLEIREGAQPLRCHSRRYSPKMSEVMNIRVKKLLDAGYIKKNNAARWCSPCYPVRKPGNDEWRMTIDYSMINARLKPMAGIMPYLPTSISVLKGMKVFGKIDLFKGFWQLPLAGDSQEILSFMTDQGIFTPTRVTQGATDSALYFQATLTECFNEMVGKNILIWIDDLLILAENYNEFLTMVKKSPRSVKETSSQS